MPDILSMSPTLALSTLLLFAAVFLGVQALVGAGRQASRRMAFANHRLKLLASDDPHEQVLARMRRARGLDEAGQLKQFLRWVNKLILHSGLRAEAWMIFPAMLAGAVILGGGVWLWKEVVPLAVIATVGGAGAPIGALVFLGKRRRARAVSQLPEALDVIVRSLSAGHPVPVAMSLVAREMPDPIGSEFGMASDEVGFGAGISTAIQRMAERIDHEDVYLFAAMIRLQERTGGNLAELLRANADTIRDRQTMRLKIKAASAEGRASALILNIAPIGVWMGVNFMAPGFYGEVEGHPWVTYGFYIIAAWMVIGNLVMRKMINFRI